jgi:hypothetical protein
MGLLVTVYGFNKGVPSLNDFEQKIRELSSEALMREGTLDPDSNDELRVQENRPAGVSLPMRNSHAEFWIEGDRPRWKRSVKLTVSLDGTKVSVVSNYHPLFESACDAMVALGGNACSPGRRSSARI